MNVYYFTAAWIVLSFPLGVLVGKFIAAGQQDTYDDPDDWGV